jgi:uncharacterized protein (TIGR03083 family)
VTTDQPTEQAADVQSLVGPQFRALADALAAQPSTIADLPSLCEGWSTRNVLAHMTMAARYDAAAFQAELAANGYDFQTLSDSIAERDGQLPLDELIEGLRSDTMAHWAPPGGGAVGALTHVVIHGLDITSALGLARTGTDATAHQVLDSLTTGGVHQYFGSQIAGRALRATDLDWAFGDGEPVTAEVGDLILAIAGRRRPRIDLRTP